MAPAGLRARARRRRRVHRRRCAPLQLASDLRRGSACSAPTGRRAWSGPGAAASPASPTGRSRCWPSVARETGADPTEGLLAVSDEVMPRVEQLQSYVWRRHLLSAGARLMAESSSGASATLAVCFIDIVGYTSRSRTLTDRELVAWLESFETAVLQLTVDRGGRIIKEHRRRAPHRRRLPPRRWPTSRSPSPPAAPRPRRPVPRGPCRRRVRRGRHPARRRLRPRRQHRRPADVGGRARARALVDLGTLRGTVGARGRRRRQDHCDQFSPPASTTARTGPGGSSYRFRRLRRVSVKGYSRLEGVGAAGITRFSGETGASLTVATVRKRRDDRLSGDSCNSSQRIVTCRFASPLRAERSSVVRSEASGEGRARASP